MPAPRPISILTATTLFPNPAKPSHGIFVETRLRKLLETGLVRATVLAPVPWLPPFVSRSSLGKVREVPLRREDRGVVVRHPRFVVVPKIGMNIAPYLLARAFYRGISEILASGEQIDLIDAHYFYPDGVSAVWAARKFGLPVVVTGRGTDLNLIPQYDWPRHLIHRAADAANGLVTVCAALKESLVEVGINERRILVLRNGVDLELFRPRDRVEAQKTLGVQGRALASVGHLTARKGHHHVIRALCTLHDHTLLIAGEGEERGALEGLARELGVADRVRFLGALPQSELRNVYNAVDALVLASSREGWANVLLEAMACGTPVVASNIWGTPEVVSGPAAGVLMPSLDAEGVVQGVRRLIAAPGDRAETRRFAEGFGWESTTQGQLDLFREILAKSGRSAPGAG